jgi:hypothetical protein
MMRDLTNSLRRQLHQLTRKVNLSNPEPMSVDRLLRILAGKVQPTPSEQAYLIDNQRQHELSYDPPDSVERFLAREFARMEGKPDPYGTSGLSDAERRSWDWKDYHEKERQPLVEQAQEEGRLPTRLTEQPPSQTMSRGNREHERQ